MLRGASRWSSSAVNAIGDLSAFSGVVCWQILPSPGSSGARGRRDLREGVGKAGYVLTYSFANKGRIDTKLTRKRTRKTPFGEKPPFLGSLEIASLFVMSEDDDNHDALFNWTQGDTLVLP